LLLYKIMHLLFFPLVRSVCALRLENRKKKKNYQHGLDAGHLEFKFLRPKGCLTNPFRTLRLLIILLKNNLPASAIAIMSWQEVSRSSLCSGVEECGTKLAHNFLFPKSSFRIRRTTVLRMFKGSAIILAAIRRSFFTKSATTAMFTSVRVDFGRPPLFSSSTRSLPSRN